MLRKKSKLKIHTPRRQISRSRTNRALLNRQRSFFLVNSAILSEEDTGSEPV